MSGAAPCFTGPSADPDCGKVHNLQVLDPSSIRSLSASSYPSLPLPEHRDTVISGVHPNMAQEPQRCQLPPLSHSNGPSPSMVPSQSPSSYPSLPVPEHLDTVIAGVYLNVAPALQESKLPSQSSSYANMQTGGIASCRTSDLRAGASWKSIGATKNAEDGCGTDWVEEDDDDEASPGASRPLIPRQRTVRLGSVKVPRWSLPAILLGSTALGALCMLTVQLPLVEELLGVSASLPFLVLCGTTLGSMVYCMVCDPGQLKHGSVDLSQHVLPRRAHKAWTHEYPIRRYDHYCRWLMTSIGLLNHREFLIMLFGLVSIGIINCCVDVVVFGLEMLRDQMVACLLPSMHLAYSIVILYIAGRILALHIGFVCRNELRQEWKDDTFYRIDTSCLPVDATIPENNALVRELTVDTYNMLDQDTFRYDPALNDFDKGAFWNCWSFWCIKRWGDDQLGEF